MTCESESWAILRLQIVTKSVGAEAHGCDQLAQSHRMQPRPGRGSNP